MTIIYILVVIAVILLLLERIPAVKGMIGEAKVNFKIKKFGILLKNYVVKDEQNHTHQIDSILVSSKGVFVFEVKNYSGRIYGKDNQREWTQVLNYGKVKHKFYSPVLQNKTHCYFIRKILNNDVYVYSYIIFTQNNTNYIDSYETINLKDIRRVLSNYGDVYNANQVDEIVNILNEHRDLNTSNREHVKNIKKEQQMINNNICPRCGGHIVPKMGKNGMFYGCENYPKCKFVKKN